MKNFFSHNSIRTQLEYLNIATGLILIALAMVYGLRGEVDYFASWFIFGCMYIVMDVYGCSSETCSHVRAKMDGFKYCTGWLGLLVSAGFLVYILIG